MVSDWDRYYWYSMPAFAEEASFLFWQYQHTGYPTPADGIITFEVLTDGPVLMACTTRWGGGGNPSGNWMDELTTREELEQQGWVEFATGLRDAERGGPEPCIEYVIFQRASVAGEVFTYRTEKYRPPAIICIPEPSTFIMCILLGSLGIAVGWWRRYFGGGPITTGQLSEW